MSHPMEIRHHAENLFIEKGLSFKQAAEVAGVSERQLRTWAKAYRWKEKRLEYREASGAMERNLTLLRSRMVVKALETLDPKAACAVARLEASASGGKVPVDPPGLPSEEEETNPDKSPKETILALQGVIDRKVRQAHNRPETLTADGIRDLRDGLELIERLKRTYRCDDGKPKGLSVEAAEEIRRKILGIP